MTASQTRQIHASRSEVRVSYPTADHFLRDYEGSLRKGWLPLEGSHDLCPGMTIKVQLGIPGFPDFEFRAQVSECVAASDNAARARLTYCGPAERLQLALARHATIVRQRFQSLVLADDVPLRSWLETLGFRTRRLPEPEELVADIARSELAVVALLVAPNRVAPYREAARCGGAEQLVHVIDQTTRLSQLLTVIEEEL